MAKVFVSRRLPDLVMDQLASLFELSCNPHDRTLSPTELVQYTKGQDGLVSLLSDKIDADYLNQVSSLKIVANYAVGYNNIDIAAAKKRNIVVTNTPGVLTETSADTAMALMLAVARRVVEADAFVRAGKWKGWYPTEFLGKDVWGSQLGIIGLGRIGRAVARRARGFNMQVSYWNRTRLSSAEEERLGLHYQPLDELIKSVDFISLHVAYTPETHHLIDTAALEKMAPSTYLINTSRGAVIDEAALVRALAAGQIAGAGLDVFEQEPRLTPGLTELNNVVLLPHLGSASWQTRQKMGELVIQNLQAFFSGDPVPNVVE